MKFKQFEMILIDTFQMDVWLPPLRFGRINARISYSQWAVEELKQYVAECLYPHDDAPIEVVIEIVNDFIHKMESFYRLNPAVGTMFLTAKETASNVQDLLNAMK